MAILRHAVPDGSTHHDLLLAPGEVPDQVREVPTWRCPEDPMGLEPGACVPVQELPRHRGLYLRLPEARTLDGDRGTVFPVHTGWHFWRDGLLWIATDRIDPLAFELTGGRLCRVAGPFS